MSNMRIKTFTTTIVTETGEVVRTDTRIHAVPVLTEAEAIEIVRESNHVFRNPQTGKEMTSLVYDSLRPEQVAAYITDDYETLAESLEWVDEQRNESAYEIIRELFDQAGNELEPDVEEKVIEWLLDHDDSDPVADLLNNTPDPVCVVVFGDDLMRVDEDFPTYPIEGEERDEILANAGDWGQWEIRFVIAPDDAKALHEHGGSFTVDSPDIGIIDTLNGCGHMIRPDREFTFTIAPGQIIPESAQRGYTWNEIACPTQPGRVLSVHPHGQGEGSN